MLARIAVFVWFKQPSLPLPFTDREGGMSWGTIVRGTRGKSCCPNKVKPQPIRFHSATMRNLRIVKGIRKEKAYFNLHKQTFTNKSSTFNVCKTFRKNFDNIKYYQQHKEGQEPRQTQMHVPDTHNVQEKKILPCLLKETPESEKCYWET